MTPLPGPGILAVTGAGLFLQEPAPVPAAVESPLPGGVAALVRFLFNLPAWLQITGFILGVLAALALLWFLWRRRQRIVTWVATRPRNAKIGLAAAAGTVVLFGAGFGSVSWNYMQHDNGFCTGCHVMGPSYVRFTQSEHNTLSCHDCHQQSLYASMRQMYLWVAERPAEIGPHAKVANTVCMRCHVTGEKEVWQRIVSTAGHRTHLESDAPALKGVQCVTCHAVEVHHFAPLDRTCAQAGCHDMNTIALGKMANQTTLHCTACHRFTAEVPALATRDSAAGTLTPGERQCFSCHEMRERLAGMNMDPSRDPHGGSCGMCHNPHRQEQPAAAKATCTTAACHAGWRDIPFHIGLAHRSAGRDCTLCHLPHQARVDPSDCAGCHQAVRERARGRLNLPLPFDTTHVIRGISWVPPADPEPPKGKGDAAPPRLASTAPRSPLRPLGLPAVADTFPHDRHRSLTCITCHTTRQGHGRLTFAPPRGCQLCHHQAPATSNCASCHEASEWAAPRAVTARVAVAGHAARDRIVTFRHETHQRLSCVACHSTAVTLDPAPAAATCQACHEGHHSAGRDCAFCHGGAGPRAAHAALADMHVACDNCHAEQVVALLTPDGSFCRTCHADKQEHYADRACTTCHFLSSPDEFRTHLRKEGGA